MADAATEVRQLPIQFQGQVIPGVFGEIEQRPGHGWLPTQNHILNLDPFILEAIKDMVGDIPEDFIVIISLQNLGQQPYINYVLEYAPVPNEFDLPGNVGGEAPGNPYANIALNAPRAVPAGSTNAISFNTISPGNTLVNFHGEANKGRYYTQSTFNGLVLKGNPPLKENPFTRQAIQKANVKRYIAQQGGRKSKKTKKSKRRLRKRRRTIRR